MLEYFKKRIKELEDEQIEAINSNKPELAEKLSFAVCELIDAKEEYQNQEFNRLQAKLN